MCTQSEYVRVIELVVCWKISDYLHLCLYIVVSFIYFLTDSHCCNWTHLTATTFNGILYISLWVKRMKGAVQRTQCILSWVLLLHTLGFHGKDFESRCHFWNGRYEWRTFHNIRGGKKSYQCDFWPLCQLLPCVELKCTRARLSNILAHPLWFDNSFGYTSRTQWPRSHFT